MSFAKVYSAQTSILKAQTISIEIDLSRGLHAFSLVGLPDKAVEESKDRVSAAIKNTGYDSPKSKNQKVVISLAPANLKKEGPIFDVGIALAYLLATGDITFDPEKKIFLGELSLDGELQPIRGILPLVLNAKKNGFKEIFLPFKNAKEGSLVKGIKVYGVQTLRELIDHLNLKKKDGEGVQKILSPHKKTKISYITPPYSVEMDDIRGQETAKRGLLIAASGGHNIALYGPPGTGKTMLARAFTSILPPLNLEAVLETTGIHSIAGALENNLVTSPPFRSPHHTSSYVSIVGGGTVPRPGEVTLAHRGVLFLDEFPEFDRRVIESLREPLEERSITIARSKGTAHFPANFILIAALNPCPCGNFGSNKQCNCSPLSLERYRKKISGPIVDRIDMWIEVSLIDYKKLSEEKTKGESFKMANQVVKARALQQKRFTDLNKDINTNSELGIKNIDNFIILNRQVRELLNQAATKLDLSPRAYHRVIKLARTIADLSEKDSIETDHMLEALQYRPKNNQVM